ncbi:YaeQ family protein [Vibrio pectenicida]|uniref:YaeQ family protein n=1 Tax=Vibrio pectenicida TaxID=62763 RepID=A0A427U6P4_9VIBR|nr:YaeQ family protein [Vibrio pectenicida]NOH70880.1 YaeQ family protein [Vibrio pectenicida]RSD32357.1 YaeQ family protein [Vibrio pectenicida]
MALKPTIFKFRLSISDTNRDLYSSPQLTIAQHPSENTTRMLARVLAYCIKYQAELTFTKGLSSIEEPDLWVKALDGTISHWIEVGEPALDRIKKATRLAGRVDIFSFTNKSDVWWEQNKNKSHQYDANIYRLSSEGIEALSEVIQRGMDLSIMISGTSVFVDCDKGSFEIQIETLQSNE